MLVVTKYGWVMMNVNVNQDYLNYAKEDFVYSMVSTFDGIGSQVRSDLCYMIYLRHLIKSSHKYKLNTKILTQ